MELLIPIQYANKVPARPPPPHVAGMAGGGISFELDGSYETNGAELEMRCMRLAMRDRMQTRKNEDFTFPSVEEMEKKDKSKWHILKNEASASGSATFTVAGVFAAYVQCRLRNPSGISSWSDTLYVPPRSKSSKTGSSKSKTPNGTTGFDATDEINPFQRLADEARSATASARIYRRSCALLCRQICLVAQRARNSVALSFAVEGVQQPILKRIESSVALIKECSAPGWLSRLLEPPNPSWTKQFREKDAQLIMEALNAGLQDIPLDTDAGFKYIGVGVDGEHGLAVRHLLDTIVQSGADLEELKAQASDLAVDFITGEQDIRDELDQNLFVETAQRIAAGAFSLQSPASGAASNAITALSQPQLEWSNSQSPLIYVSGACSDVGHRGDGFLDMARSIIMGGADEAVAPRVVTTEELLQGDEEGEFELLARRLPAVQDHLRRCSVFVAVITPGYASAKYCKHELETVWKLHKPILSLLRQGGTMPQGRFMLTFEPLDFRGHAWVTDEGIRSNLRQTIAGLLNIDPWWSRASTVTSVPIGEKGAPVTDPDSQALKDWLEEHDLATHLEALQALGVKKLSHLSDVDDEDMSSLAMTTVELKRFKRVLGKLKDQALREVNGQPTPILLSKLSTTSSSYDRGSVVSSPRSMHPKPFGCDYHVFLSHKQANAGDQVQVMSVMFQVRGLSVWYDMEQKDITEAGMQEGVSKSGVVVLFLSNGVLERPFVQFELRHAIQLGKPILLVHEADERHGKFEFTEFDSPSVPQEFSGLKSDVVSLPYRRLRYEQEAFFDELVHRILNPADCAYMSSSAAGGALSQN